MSTRDGLSLQDHIGRWQSRPSALPAKATKRPKGPKGLKAQAPAAVSVKDALAAMLTTALELEFATIPPYLCALWSIKNERHAVANSLREIVQEEMLHMGLTCNMLAAIGVAPPLVALAPTYPGPLPSGVHPGLVVQLQGLNKNALRGFLQIEVPETPAKSVPLEGDEPDLHVERTIGAFYECVAAAFEQYAAEGGTFQLDNQVSASLVWRVIASVKDVKAAIGIITTQGEGATLNGKTGGSPRDSGRNDYAHYYRFLEMWKQKRLVPMHQPKAKKERYEWHAGYTFPDCWPMGPVPDVGFGKVPDHVQQLLVDFDRTYHQMLALLQAAWLPGGQGKLVRAMAKMFELERYAKPLMAIERDAVTKLTYGPLFTKPAQEPTK